MIGSGLIKTSTLFIIIIIFFIPDEKYISLALIGLGHRATEVSLSVLNVRLLVKDLDEVEVAVVGLLQLVQRELEVDLLLLLKGHVIMSCPIRNQYKVT